MKDVDDTLTHDAHELRDQAFLAALKARRDGFVHTARALDALVGELAAPPVAPRGARRGK